MYELPYKIKKKCCHVLLWIEHSIIFFCCSKLCYQAFKYHFESCMCHVDFVYKAMISSKEIRRTGNDMKATVRFNVFLNVQNLILKKPNATFSKLLNGFIILCLGILYFPFILLWFSKFNILCLHDQIFSMHFDKDGVFRVSTNYNCNK